MNTERLLSRSGLTIPRRAPERTLAPSLLERLRTRTGVRGAEVRDTGVPGAQPAVTAVLWLMVVAYGAFFIYMEWLRYHTFLMHAEDMGNYEQAMFNTAHGHFFEFNNQRIKSGIEATGYNTRLAIHVEPILLLLAIPYLVHASPVNLFVIQTLVVASGVFPIAWLARRYLHSALAQIAFPLAYLLAPPLEAANLYEFHAVTLSAALLLWALYFADGGRYRLFALFAVLAVFTKEEIGLVVALLGLWLWWRHRGESGARAIGLTTAILSLGWSLFAVLVIIRHFHHGPSSPFCGRFNPYIINGHNNDVNAQKTSCGDVLKLWLQHPDQVLSIVFTTQKYGFLHRMFVTTGYLSLLSPLTLALSLPSYALILGSNDVHMYSGLGHYPAEIVPIMFGAAIIGVAWLAYAVGPRLRIPPAAITTVACLWLLVASVANARVNGFTPLAEGFSLPQETSHDRVGDKILAMIPPHAAVAADDYLNPHLSDRRNIYLFPIDMNDAQYAVADVSRDNFPDKPVDEMNLIRLCFLQKVIPGCAGNWGIRYAEDGYILLERRGLDPHLSTTLRDFPAFYNFVVPPSPPAIPHPLRVDFGPALQLVGYNVERREQVNLRQPDILLTTYWRLTRPLTTPVTPTVFLTNGAGAPDVFETDFPATDWLPITRWPAGRIIVMQSVPLTVFTNDNGKIDIDIGVTQPQTTDIYDWTHFYLPNVRWTPGHVPLEVVGQPAAILKLAQVPAVW